MVSTRTNGFGDENFFDTMKNFQIPGFDYEATMHMYRRNMEVMTQAQKALLDMAKEISTLNTEFTHQMVEGIREHHKCLTEAKSMEERSQLATQSFKSQVENVIAHNRKVAEIWTKSCTAAGEKIQTRVQESVNEAQKMAQKGSGR